MSAAQKSAVRQVALQLLMAEQGYTPFAAMKQAILKLRQGIVRS